MISLRPYQDAAINAARDALMSGKSRVLIVAPTGSGKSILSGKIAALAASKNRVLILCSQSHLIKQNLEKFMLFTDVKAGVYCAGLGRKDTTEQVIFASRDSLGRKPDICGSFGLIVLDEAHQLDTTQGTTYKRIMDTHPNALVVGMTGTPWRLSGGRIWGKDKFFEGICYNIGMEVLRKEGFLVSYAFPSVNTKIDTEGIKTAKGDFHIGQLEERSSNKAIISGAVKEWLQHEPTKKCTMFFCVTRNHAQKVCEELYNYLREDQVVYVDGDTPDREEIFEKIRAGEYKAVVSIGTLTTGFDAPIVDCIVMLRATKSTSLFVQICGRGLRPYQGKENLLILDFAQNFTRFGTLENPMVTNMGLKAKSDNSEGSDQKKNCDSCAAEISFFARECGFCGEIFKLNHSRSAHRQGDKAQLHRMKVMSVFVEPHIKKDTSERGFKVTWRVLKDGKLRQLFEFFMVHRSPAIKLAYERRRAQMNADPLFVIASIDGIFIKPVEVETAKVVL